ncbi:hypothetical protein HDU78_008318 [Chytriomyces hyalinus]|nr:hypothetical protein HDU78_008318 [Chytriomyces hyalinus]
MESEWSDFAQNFFKKDQEHSLCSWLTQLQSVFGKSHAILTDADIFNRFTSAYRIKYKTKYSPKRVEKNAFNDQLKRCLLERNLLLEAANKLIEPVFVHAVSTVSDSLHKTNASQNREKNKRETDRFEEQSDKHDRDQSEEEIEDDDELIWPSDDPPKFFKAAKKKLLELRKLRKTDESVAYTALYWKIIDLNQLEELKSFLKPRDIKFVRDIFSKSLENFSTPKCVSNAENVIRALEKLQTQELEEVCRVMILNGPVGGLRKLAAYIQRGATTNPVKKYDEISLYLEKSECGQSTDLETLLTSLVSVYDKEGTFDDDVKYVLNLFKKGYEMIAQGIPSRQNTERDLDANYFWTMFSCLEGIAAMH